MQLISRSFISRAQSTCGVSFLVGFESEFILLKSTSPPIAVNNADWSVADAYRTGATETTVLEEICDALQRAGIELHMSHAEAAPGQVSIFLSISIDLLHFGIDAFHF